MKKELDGREEKNETYITREEFYDINKNTEKKLNEADRKIEKVIQEIYKVNSELSHISGDIKLYEKILQNQRKLLQEEENNRKKKSLSFFERPFQIKEFLFIISVILLLLGIEYLLI